LAPLAEAADRTPEVGRHHRGTGMTRIFDDMIGTIVASTSSKQFSRRWSGPKNPMGRPGQKPVAKPPVVIDHGPGTTLDDPWLVDLVAEIRSAIEAFNNHTSAAVDAVIRVGERLAEAKKVIGHGRFLGWVAANCHLSERSVQDYLRLYEHRDQVRAKYAAGSADFSMRSALKMLAKPREGSAASVRPTANPAAESAVEDRTENEVAMAPGQAVEAVNGNVGFDDETCDHLTDLDARKIIDPTGDCTLIDPKISAAAMKHAQKIAVEKSAEWLEDYFEAFRREMARLIAARRR
jgi:hypothetical protein